jgi:hypothetical protein
VDFRPIAPATVWVPSCSRLILIVIPRCPERPFVRGRRPGTGPI